jgi:hypothetical protein
VKTRKLPFAVKGTVMRFTTISTRSERRRSRKIQRAKIGPRVFVFLIVSAVTLGAIAISMNVRLEDWEKTHHRHAE